MTSRVYQIMPILLGEGANGKSVIADLLYRLVGARNATTIDLHRFQSPEALAFMEGKLLNVASELSIRRLGGDSELKAVISGDMLNVSTKSISSYTIKPYIKVMVCTNRMPSIRDASEGFMRRLRVLKFNNVVPEEQRDPCLLEKLAKEIPGIIAWAIQGLHRLIKQGCLTEPVSSGEVLDAYRDEVDPLRVFVGECLHSSDDRSGYKKIADLYQAYVAWGKDQGYKVSENVITLGRRLAMLGFESHKSGTTIWHVKVSEEGKKYLPREDDDETPSVEMQIDAQPSSSSSQEATQTHEEIRRPAESTSVIDDGLRLSQRLNRHAVRAGNKGSRRNFSASVLGGREDGMMNFRPTGKPRRKIPYRPDGQDV